MGSCYIVDKTPVFLTFHSYSDILQKCKDTGLLVNHPNIIFAGNKKAKKNEYDAICTYLQFVKDSNPNDFDKIKSFSCYSEEAQANLFNLLDSFGYYYSRSKFKSKLSFSFESLSKINSDVRFPEGRLYYFCYIADSANSGIKILINSNDVESFHGNLESFIVFFNSGMVLKCNYGIASVYFDPK